MIWGKLLAPLKWIVAALGLLAILAVSALAAMRKVAQGARAEERADQLEETLEAKKRMDAVKPSSSDDVADSLRDENF